MWDFFTCSESVQSLVCSRTAVKPEVQYELLMSVDLPGQSKKYCMWILHHTPAGPPLRWCMSGWWTSSRSAGLLLQELSLTTASIYDDGRGAKNMCLVPLPPSVKASCSSCMLKNNNAQFNLEFNGGTQAVHKVAYIFTTSYFSL